jgi:hypothetical protein
MEPWRLNPETWRLTPRLTMEPLLGHNGAVEAQPGAVDVCRPVLQIRVFLLRILDPHHSEKTDPNRREKQDLWIRIKMMWISNTVTKTLATCIRGSGVLPVPGIVECYLYPGQWSATCIRGSGVLPVSGAVKRRCTCCTSCRGRLCRYIGTWY